MQGLRCSTSKPPIPEERQINRLHAEKMKRRKDAAEAKVERKRKRKAKHDKACKLARVEGKPWPAKARACNLAPPCSLARSRPVQARAGEALVVVAGGSRRATTVAATRGPGTGCTNARRHGLASRRVAAWHGSAVSCGQA